MIFYYWRKEKEVMKGKKPLSTLLAIILTLSVMSIANASLTIEPEPFTPPQPGTWIYVQHYTFFDEANLTGTLFNVTVGVYNVNKMKGFEFKLDYNTTLLNAIRAYPTPISEGATKWLPVDENMDFHWDAPPTINDELGRVWIMGWGFSSYTGNGAVITITFEIDLAPPREQVAEPQNKTVSCALDLYDTEITNYIGDPQTHSVYDGSYTYIRPQIYVPPPEYTLTITSSAGGTTDPAPGAYSYPEGTVVSVTAIPDLGYNFDHWELDGSNIGSANPTSVTMDADHALHAVFTPAPVYYDLTITATTGGTTSPAPGVHSYAEGTVVSVTAIPDLGYNFDHWELDGSNIGSANPTSVTMDADHALHAVFVEIPPVPPVASFTEDPEVPYAGEQVTFTSTSYDPDGSIASWEWDFTNDGTIEATTEVATWTYETAGQYTVNLTVTDDDGLTNSTTHIKTVEPLPEVHDVAITGVVPDPTEVSVGEDVTITVYAKNEGTLAETFDVSVYYDSNLIGTQTVIDLDAGLTTTLLFVWSTVGVPEATYTIKAEASVVSGETDTADNIFIDGTVTIKPPPVLEPVLWIRKHGGRIYPAWHHGYYGEAQILYAKIVNTGNLSASVTVKFTVYVGVEEWSYQVSGTVAAGDKVTLYTDPIYLDPGKYLVKAELTSDPPSVGGISISREPGTKFTIV